jgi:predicted dinucleotide-binding enzyme
MIGTRDVENTDLQQWLRDTQEAKVGSFEEAARFGEMIVLVTLGRAAESAIDQAGPANFTGKTVIDATNPLADAPPVNGVLQYFMGPNESLGERIQATLPAAHVVKAFNSVGNTRMVNPQYTLGVPTMFICGNSEEAKSQVSEVIRQFRWEPFDCGSITSARAIEPLCMLWCIPGFLRNQWTHAFKVLTH